MLKYNFEIGDKIFIGYEAFCYDFENDRGFVGSWMFNQYGNITDIREEINGEVNFGINYLIEIPCGLCQWVAEECLHEISF